MQKTVQNSRQHHRRIETESGDAAAAAGKARKTDERVQNLDTNESRGAAGSGPARRSEVGRPAGPTAKRLLQTKRDIASLKSVHLPGTQRAEATWPPHQGTESPAAQEAGSEKGEHAAVAGASAPHPPSRRPAPRKPSAGEDGHGAAPSLGPAGHEQRPPRVSKRPGNGAGVSHI